MLSFQFLFQVGKKLSELIRDSGGQSAGGEQNRWQTELAQVTFELIGVSTNYSHKFQSTRPDSVLSLLTGGCALC